MNDRRNYFIVNLHESMKQGRDMKASMCVLVLNIRQIARSYGDCKTKLLS